MIFDQRAGTPGDPINGLSTRTDVDFIFGDEDDLIKAADGEPDRDADDHVRPGGHADGRGHADRRGHGDANGNAGRSPRPGRPLPPATATATASSP